MLDRFVGGRHNADAINAGELDTVEHRTWNGVRAVLDTMSATRAAAASSIRS